MPEASFTVPLYVMRRGTVAPGWPDAAGDGVAVLPSWGGRGAAPASAMATAMAAIVKGNFLIRFCFIATHLLLFFEIEILSRS